MRLKGIVKFISFSVFSLLALAVAAIAILNSTDLSPFKENLAQQIADVTGREVTIDGALNLDISLTPVINIGGVKLSNAAWAKYPNMLRVDDFSAEVDLIPLLSGDIQINKLKLNGVSIWLENAANNKQNWIFNNQDSATNQTPPSNNTLPIVLDAQLSKIEIVYSDQNDGDKKVYIDYLNLFSASPTAPIKWSLSGSMNEQSLQMTGQIPAFTSWQSNQRQPVQFNLDTMGINLSGNGFSGVGTLDAKININIKSVTDTLRSVQSIVPDFNASDLPKLGNATLSARLLASTTSVSVEDMVLKFNDSDLSGKLSVEILNKIIKVRSQLTSKKMNLSPFTGLIKSDGQAKPATQKIFSNQPLKLPSLKPYDIDVRFQPEKIIADNLVVTNTDIRLIVADEKIIISPIKTDIAGGAVKGQIDIGTATPKIELNLSADVKNIDFEKLFVLLNQKNSINGKLDGNIIFSGNGISVASLMASANGRLRLVTENSKLNITGFDFLTNDITDIIPGFSSGDIQFLRCGVVDFDIKKGKSSVRSMVFVSEPITAIGTGSINLSSETIMLRITPKVINTSLASVALVPVDITGTFTNPDYVLDKTALIGNAAGTALKSVGAIATLGVSLLAEKTINDNIDQTNYCKPALAGKKVTLMNSQPSSTSSTTSTPTENNKKSAPENPAESIVNDLKSLFGN